MTLTPAARAELRFARKLARLGLHAEPPTPENPPRGKTEAAYVASYTELFGRAPSPRALEIARENGQIAP